MDFMLSFYPKVTVNKNTNMPKPDILIKLHLNLHFLLLFPTGFVCFFVCVFL